MIENTINSIGTLEHHHFLVLDEDCNIIYQSKKFPKIYLAELIPLVVNKPPIYNFQVPSGNHILYLKSQKKRAFFIFKNYEEYSIKSQYFIDHFFELLINFSNLYNEEIHSLNDAYAKRHLDMRLIHAIENCDYSQIPSIAKLYLSYSFPDPHKIDFYYLHNLIIALITGLTRIVMRIGVDKVDAYKLSDDYLHFHFSISNLKEAEILTLKIIYNYMFLVEKHNYNNLSPLVVKAIQYIRENIDTTLYVNEIANYLEITPEYLSSLFKKELSLSPKNYINSEKVNKAKYLLISTEHSITDISTQLGYSSSSHFSSIFKSLTKQTPSSYRLEWNNR